VQEADGRCGCQEVSTLRALTRFSATIQKSGRVPDFFWLPEIEEADDPVATFFF
jgi:hypothetical protein